MLLGRDDELGAIDELLASARAGRGGAAFATGEPGIGKSALLAAARQQAEAAGMLVVAGAAWEGGGAPAYWPWRQLLRDAARRAPDAASVAIGAALARLAPAGDVAPAAADAGAARFALFEDVVDALLGLARATPVLVLLDDLHAADLASIDLLIQLARELPRASLAIVGAWRDGDLAVRPDAAQRLARAARGADALPLRRLSADELARWVAGTPIDAARLYQRTEGNPLFVVEAVRAGGEVRATGGVGAAIRDHLALLRPAVAAALAAASVLGRDVDSELVAAVAGVDRDAAAALLHEAAGAGVLVRRGDGWSFAHVLVRDELFAALAPSRRAALHRAAGRALLARDPVDARGAHHLLAAADPSTIDLALAAARVAADHADRSYGFEVAAELHAAAAAAAEAAGRPADAIDRLLDLGAARTLAGQVGAGREACVRAAALARRLEEPERLARAALGYGAELVTARRDPVMIELLTEAEAAVPPGATPLRACLIARLAAALSPPGDAAEYLRMSELAERALTMADMLGDDHTALYVHRYAAHSFGQMVPMSRVLELADRTCALAERLRRPLDALDAHGLRIAGRLALGDAAGADVARNELLAILAPVRSPHHAWRPHLVQANAAILAGRFADAERHLALVHAFAREHDLPRAAVAAAFGDLALVNARRDPARVLAEAEPLLRLVRGFGKAPGLEAWMLGRAGRFDEARATLAGEVTNPSLLNVFGHAEAAVMIGDREAGARVFELCAAMVETHMLAVGPAGFVLGVVATTAGTLCRLLGRVDDAVGYLDRALGLARAIAATPHLVHAAVALAATLRERGRPADRDRAGALEAEVATTAARLGIPVAGSSPSPPPPATPVPVLGREGDRWRLRWRDADVWLPDVKGLRYLELLLAAPDREIHVHELIGDDAEASDAGLVLDASARRAYQARLQELGAALDEATRHHDLGRAEKAQAEIDALTDQLTAAIGLGGRARRAGSTVERARINVQRRLRDALARIAAQAPALGRVLEASVHTGVFCRFDGTMFHGLGTPS